VDWYNIDSPNKHNHFYHPFFGNSSYDKDIYDSVKECGMNISYEKLFPENYGETFSTDGYGYHFDASKLISVLREKCINSGCKIIGAKVEDCRFNPDGSIKSVILDDSKEIFGDYFVDCTGFRRVLISRMKDTFLDLSDKLICNSAVATHVDFKNEKEYHWTKCTALSSGWAWSIPLQNKTGAGYVYSDKHISDDSAKKELSKHLGVEGDYQLLKWTPGFLEEPFIKNCVAIGLSAGFIEPLEATNYHMQWITITKLKPWIFGKVRNSDVNIMISRTFMALASFITSHYVLSKRNDSEFWKHFNNLKMPQDIKSIIDDTFNIEPSEFFKARSWTPGGSEVSPQRLSWLYLLVSYDISSAENEGGTLPGTPEPVNKI